MKYPRWKTALSYLTDLPLSHWNSEKNGRIEVALSRGQLKLSTDNAVYSYGTNYRSFAVAFDTLKLYSDTSIRSVLVLGWGIGSIAELLQDHPSIDKITGLEHDESLVDYFNQVRRDQYSFEIHIVAADAINFIHEQTTGFDLICSDIFIDNKTPESVVSPDYLKALRNAISPTGRILLSKLSLSLADKEQNQLLESNLRSLGIDFKVINTIGNRMYHWKNDVEL